MTANPLRVGVIGTTSYAETHMRNITAHPGAVLAAISGRDLDRAVTVGARYGVSEVYSGYENMLADARLDAVAVLAPDELHEEIAAAAFAAGIHVLCEKPLARTPEAAERMTQAARSSGLVNMSYFFLRTSPFHRLVRSLLESGAIGEIRSASFTLEHGFFHGDGYNWRFDSSRGGGVIADLACYLFDLGRWYIGDIRAVAAHETSFVHRPHPEGKDYTPSADSAVGILSFDEGVHATFEVSVISTIGESDQRSAVTLQGSNGRLELVHTFRGAHLRGAVDGEAELHDIPLPPEFVSPDGDAEFIDAILGGAPVRPTFEDGWRVQQVVAAAERAAATRTWIEIPGEDVE